jgi:hypothetical protein
VAVGKRDSREVVRVETFAREDSRVLVGVGMK